MRKIAIYVEGGGDTAQQRSELRRGLDHLFAKQKEAARTQRLGWKIVPCGRRDKAYKDFMNSVRSEGESTLCALLVDSEEVIPPERSGTTSESQKALIRYEHLKHRDGWPLTDVNADCVHLMVVCMETWIVADPDGMAAYYGQGFRQDRLPQRPNLEEEPKDALYAKLVQATKGTSKGEYSDKANAKIKHASQLLQRIEAEKVAERCPRFATLIRWLEERIQRG